jgi:hypothetical protein
MQTDPIGFAAGDVNLYRYAENNTATLRDPSGLAPQNPNTLEPFRDGLEATFDPTKSSRNICCTKIGYVQVAQILVKTRDTLVPDMVIKPSQDDKGSAGFDEITTPSGYFVDVNPGSRTPVYRLPSTRFGYYFRPTGSPTPVSKDASFKDYPQQEKGTEAGWYDPKTNPNGVMIVRLRFETFAYCASGPDHGSFYEGFSWEFYTTRSAVDGRIHTSAKVTQPLLAAPSGEFMAAFQLFNKVKRFKP